MASKAAITSRTNDIVTTEDYADFYKWFLKFTEGRNYGYMIKPYGTPQWFDKVQTQHQKIREAIGGVRLGKDIAVPEQEKPIDYEIARKCWFEIHNNIS